MPQIGRLEARTPSALMPKSDTLSWTVGKIPRGTLNRARSSSSQSCVWMLKMLVRAALVASVACTCPAVNCQTSQLSTVPKASSPALRARAHQAHCRATRRFCWPKNKGRAIGRFFAHHVLMPCRRNFVQNLPCAGLAKQSHWQSAHRFFCPISPRFHADW